MEHPRTQLPSRDEFSAVVNSRFGVSANGDPPVEFTLIECNTLTHTDTQECYSLLFCGPSDQPAVQGTYRLENHKLGNLELFLVPIKRDDQGVYFEAIMNHILSR
jgi:hypothetical protein